MNYLAHVFLSGENDDVMFGNFIGDFIKGKQYEKYSGGVKQGILLHRAIDTFTDSHPVYLKSMRKFYNDFPKISGIITDILYDHLLCKEWSKYSDLNLDQFIEKTYRKLDLKVNLMPDKMDFLYYHLRENNWFLRYQSEQGTALSLSQIGRRIGFPSDVGEAIKNYKKDEKAFVEEFNAFFTDLIDFTQEFNDSYPGKIIIE